VLWSVGMEAVWPQTKRVGGGRRRYCRGEIAGRRGGGVGWRRWSSLTDPYSSIGPHSSDLTAAGCPLFQKKISLPALIQVYNLLCFPKKKYTTFFINPYSLHPKIECIVTSKIYIKIQCILYNDNVLIWQGLLKRRNFET
jgi:hypothetical protein